MAVDPLDPLGSRLPAAEPADRPAGTPPAAHRSAARRPLSAADLWALAAVGLLGALAWLLAPVLLLAFAGVLLALVLLSLAEPLARHSALGPLQALALVVVGLATALVLVFWLAGAGAAEQLQALRDTLPRAWAALRDWLAQQPGGPLLLDALAAASRGSANWANVAGIATGTLNALAGALGAAALVIGLGVYLAAAPDEYRRGLLMLVPPAGRPRAARALGRAARDLEGWLRGQAVSMLAVGVLSFAGLAAIGLPLAFSLSLVAALLDFVPYFGPVIAGVLVVAVALTEGEDMALKALLVVLAVQQAEAWLVQPLAQRWAVRLPPVLALMAVLVFGALFGLAGVLLAVPLIVLTRTLVVELYVRGVLGGDGTADDGRAAARAPALPPERSAHPRRPTLRDPR